MTYIKKSLSKQAFKKTIFSMVLLLTSIFSFAQGPDGPPDLNPDVPLTGAQYLLLAMATGFVVFKIWQHNHKKKTQAV